MNITDLVKSWARRVGLSVPEEYTATPPSHISRSIAEARESRQIENKAVDQLSELMASGEPLAWANIRATVEYIWSGEIVPDDFTLFGGDEGVSWLYERALEAEKEIVQKAAPKSTGIKFYKDATGINRWFGWASNNFMDREKEIITDSAHREFVAYLDEHPEEAPELWSWHTEGTARKHRADWWDYAHGFLMFSGPLEEDEAKAYTALGDDIRVGMSHGFKVYDRKGPFIFKYRSFEVSDLPIQHAANPYTSFHIDEVKEMSGFSESKRQYLSTLLGPERVAELEAATAGKEKELDALGLSRKEIDEGFETYLKEQAKAEAQRDLESILDVIMDRLNVEELKSVLDNVGEDLEALKADRARVEALEAEVKALKATEDERLLTLITPRSPINWTATKDESNVVKEEDLEEKTSEAVKEATSQMSWLRGMIPSELGG